MALAPASVYNNALQMQSLFQNNLTLTNKLDDDIKGLFNNSDRFASFENKYGNILPNDLQNKIVYDRKTQNYYKLNVTISENAILDTEDEYLQGNAYIDAYNLYKADNGFNEDFAKGFYSYHNINSTNGNWITRQFLYRKITIKYDIYTQSNNTYKFTISSNRNGLQNQPYDILTFPIFFSPKAMRFEKFTSAITPRLSNQGYIGLFQKLAQDSTSTNLIDLQVLPYCPVGEASLYHDEGSSIWKLDSNLVLDKDYSEIKVKSGENFILCGYAFYLYDANFSYNIQSPIKVEEQSSGVDLKIKSETELYRLCSPNYQGLFDFNPYKNGFLNQLNIYGTLKPYNSFINIQPVFSGLYGQNFQDYRGLRLGGNFSVSRSVNAWQNFELNNKNYQNIFNREI